MITLRPYQDECIQAVDECTAREQLIVLPTGTGKTVVFSSIIQQRGGTALVIAHRDELLQQAAEKLRTVAPELAMNIGFVQAARNDVNAPIVIASVQTLASRKRLQQLPQHFRTVIVDEAHHAPAASYRRVFEHVAPSDLLLGFTATAERHDKRTDLRTVFAEMPYARSLLEMITAGYLCDLRAERVTLDQLDLSKVKKSRGDFQADALGAALEAADAVDHAVAAYLEHALDRPCVAFFPTVALSRDAATAFQSVNVDARHIDGTTPRDERRQHLADLTRGTARVICNVGVLTEGFDEPSLSCIIIAAPTKSRIKYAQMVGRGTRLYPGKTDCLILDLAGVTEDLSIQSVGVLFGLKKPPKPRETATQAVTREKTEDDEKRERLMRRTPRRTTPTRSRPVQLFNAEAIPWVHVGDRWIVGLKGDQHIVLDPTHDRIVWRVLIMGPNLAKVIARNLDLGYAQGAAETIIRDSGTIGLTDKDAPWRQTPATAAQIGRLCRAGVTPPGACTKGQASDLLTKAIATERLRRFDNAIHGERIA